MMPLDLGSELDLKINYAQHLDFPGVGVLSPGIGVGITNVGFQPTWLAPDTWDDVSLDPDLPIGSGGTGVDINFGLFWRGVQNYYIGLSATHLTQPFIQEVNFEKARHYYLTGGIDIDYSMLSIADGLTLKPSFLAISDGVSTTFDLTLLGDYDLTSYQHVYGGLTYRRKDAVALLIGFGMDRSNDDGEGLLEGEPDHWTLGYSYDITTSSINNTSRGSHELMFKYCVFPPDPSKARHGNPFILR